MFNRTISLIGEENLRKIKNSNIFILGAGGVGGYAIETLIRSGIENITIADYDNIDISNINRQLIAYTNNIGKKKVEEWQKRILLINPNVKVKTISQKITEDNISLIFNEKYNFIIDACDTVPVKKLLIKMCKEKNIPLITVCGMGKKKHPELVRICDIRDTSYDPLAKELRKYVKEENIKGHVPCVFSSEKIEVKDRKIVSSMVMVPSVAGILSASYVINKIIEK